MLKVRGGDQGRRGIWAIEGVGGVGGEGDMSRGPKGCGRYWVGVTGGWVTQVGKHSPQDEFTPLQMNICV